MGRLSRFIFDNVGQLVKPGRRMPASPTRSGCREVASRPGHARQCIIAA
jgi:hypothetical protein